MFLEFKDILAIISWGSGIFSFGIYFWSFPFTSSMKESDRDYLDHLIPLFKIPSIHHELADHYPSFHSGLETAGQKSLLSELTWDFLGFQLGWQF